MHRITKSPGVDAHNAPLMSGRNINRLGRIIAHAPGTKSPGFDTRNTSTGTANYGERQEHQAVNAEAETLPML